MTEEKTGTYRLASDDNLLGAFHALAILLLNIRHENRTRHQRDQYLNSKNYAESAVNARTRHSVISLVTLLPSAVEAMIFSAESVCMGDDGSTSAQL
jgi:hypothetical protein